MAFKLSVIRSFFEHSQAAGTVALNPAATKLLPPPEVSSHSAGRALTCKEVRYLPAGLSREEPEGARNRAMMPVVLRLAPRVSKICSLRASSARWSLGRWTLRCKVEGGGDEVWLLPKDAKEARVAGGPFPALGNL